MLRIARFLRGLRAKSWLLTVRIFIFIFYIILSFVFWAHWGAGLGSVFCLPLSFFFFFLSPKLGNSNGYFIWSRELGVDYWWLRFGQEWWLWVFPVAQG